MAIEFYQGTDSYVVYGEETSYGSGATPAAGNRVGKVQSITLNMTNNFFRTQGMGEGRNATGAVTGPFDVTGSIEWDVDDFTFMQYAIGTLSGTGTDLDPYEIQELDNIGYDATNIPSLELEIGSEGDSNDKETTVNGVVINTLTITGTQGDKLKASCDFIGRSVTSSTSIITYTTPTTKVFVFQQGAVTIGADTFHCMSFALTVSNNAQTYRNLGSRFIQQPVFGVRRYDFTITFKYKYDDTGGILSGTELLDYFYGSANTPTNSGTMTAYAVSLDITEGAASGDRVVNIDLENCYFESWSQPMPLDGGVIEITVNGFGLAGLTDGANKVPIRWYAIA
jgi:hypothetical protein